jgi:hypothetical protein
MTNQDPASLVELAKSWNRPPKMEVLGKGIIHGAYDYTERAYILDMQDQEAAIELEFNASDNNPLFNLALVVNNWGGQEVSLSLNGKNIALGKDFRTGIEYDVEGNMKLIVWIRHKAQNKTSVRLSPVL